MTTARPPRNIKGMDTNQTLAQVQAETNRTLTGHWHPRSVACSTDCPMGDPATAGLFRKTLDHAITAKPRPKLAGYYT